MIFLGLILIYSIFILLLAIKFNIENSFVLHSETDISISVLVAFRNEESNIKNIINELKSQNYSSGLLQYILVNDNSTDKSYKIALQETQKDDRFIVLDLNGYSGKKQALKFALKYSKGEIIVHTDADVILNPNWLKTISNFYLENKFKLALAPVIYTNENNLFQKLQSLEITNIAGITAGSALLNMPLMANGANIAYHKSIKHLFVESINLSASGDDMFFLEEVKKAFPNQIRYLKSKNAIVHTFAEKNIISLINQRLRWLGKSKYFKNPYIISVGTFTTIINLLVILGVFIPFVLSEFSYLYIYFLLIKFVAELISSIIYCKYFKKLNLIPLVPLLFVIYPFYVIFIGSISIFKTPSWKNN